MFVRGCSAWHGLWIVLGLLIVLCQWRLWIGEGSRTQAALLSQQVAALEAENEQRRARNAALAAEVRALQAGGAALEECARSRLGMIREGETFFLFTSPVSE